MNVHFSQGRIIDKAQPTMGEDIKELKADSPFSQPRVVRKAQSTLEEGIKGLKVAKGPKVDDPSQANLVSNVVRFGRLMCSFIVYS